MDRQDSELIEKIRQQFDKAPYPRIPLEESPQNAFELLYLHNLVTAYYLRNKRVVNPEGKLILDAGCGTGYKSLVLALANPGAEIIGIDLSEESVKLAQQRLQYHAVKTARFYTLKIEDLPSLGLQFDYINADDVLYLLPNIVIGLEAMKSVLKPEGILRTNLHSLTGRTSIFRAQAVFKLMGLMEQNPRELEIEIAQETMKALRDDVGLKQWTWKEGQSESEEWILMNYLFQGDKGYMIPEMFNALASAGLEFISMVRWKQWDVMELFSDPDNLPTFLAMSLPETSVEEKLHLFELLHPVHRLLDFWCGHQDQAQPSVPVASWSVSEWETAKVHLHPQLRSSQIKQDLLKCIANQTSFEISRYITMPTRFAIMLESTKAAYLLPLWDNSESVMSLVKRWLQVRPLHPVTFEPIDRETAFEEIKELLIDLEACLYVLLEP